eukprot:scaffold1537_cov162-Ochromonas_danica.AAC.12
MTNEKTRAMSIIVKNFNEDWAVCLSHALRRSQCLQATIRLRGVYSPVRNLKSMLQPCQLRLESFTSESSLINALQNLPDLNSLYLKLDGSNDYTDATLAAITLHASSLIELDMDISSIIMISSHCYHFSDKVLSELLRTCQLLKILRVPDCGMESLLTVSRHCCLREVCLSIIAQSVSKEMIDGFLFSKEAKWPLTLEVGYIQLHDCIYYVFEQESHGWTR